MGNSQMGSHLRGPLFKHHLVKFTLLGPKTALPVQLPHQIPTFQPPGEQVSWDILKNESF